MTTEIRDYLAETRYDGRAKGGRGFRDFPDKVNNLQGLSGTTVAVGVVRDHVEQHVDDARRHVDELRRR